MNFSLGVNYWPRRSGVRLYRNFDPESVRREFAEIRELGCDTVRIFALWDDFQPIREFPGGHGTPRAVAMRDDWNADALANPALLDPAMLEKFDHIVEAARANGLRLIVSLLTAWMSGTLFEPMFRNGRSYFSHPFMLKYQMLYCRYFAARYANDPVILYWEFGNEQNCVAPCESPETAWVWMQSLALSIRQGDPAGEIAGGMHGLQLFPGRKSPWGLRECAEAVDCLTTHPYPEFTPGCFQESPLSLRSHLHATAQSVYYAALGNRKVLCEETGSLGASVISERECAAYLRMRLYSLLAHNVTGCLWWCYSDFSCGDDLPYRDVLMENDGLGLFRADGSPRPAALEMKQFAEVLKKVGELPPRQIDAAILVSDLAEDFPTALTCYALCKQAGIEPEFVSLAAAENLAGYPLLIAPSFAGHAPCTVNAYNRLIAAVEAGSTLYWSGDGATVLQTDRLFGIRELDKIPTRTGSETLVFGDGSQLDIKSRWRSRIFDHRAEVWAALPDQSACVTAIRHARGNAVFSALPIERSLAGTPYALEDGAAAAFYRRLAELAEIRRSADFPGLEIERTWHPDGEISGFLTVINHAGTAVSGPLPGARLIAGSGGCVVENGTLRLGSHHAAILHIQLDGKAL